MPKKKRKTTKSINVRLSEQEDPRFSDTDLIEWWEQQPNGSGAAIVKAALRQYIASASDTTSATRADLESAAQWIVAQASKDTTLLKASFDMLARAVAALSKQIESGVRVTGAAASSAAPTEAQRPMLTPEEIAERDRKIKKSGW